MTIASDISLLAQRTRTITFYGGYAIDYDGRTIRFPPATTLAERRNEKGRVTYGLYQFPDLSKLEMKHAENQYTRFKVIS